MYRCSWSKHIFQNRHMRLILIFKRYLESRKTLRNTCISSIIIIPVSIINIRNTINSPLCITTVITQCISVVLLCLEQLRGYKHHETMFKLSMEVRFCGNLGKESKRTGAPRTCLCRPACLADLLVISQKASASQ